MASVSDTRQTGFQRGAASVRCSIVPWDTAIMGSVVGQLEGLRTGDPDETAALLGDILGWSDDVSAVLVACRLDHRALTESMALESIGYRYVETIMRPVLDLARPVDAVVPPVEVGPAGPDDVPALAAIARDAFTTGRFAVDTRLPSHINGARYAAWVESSLRNPAHRVHVAREDGAVAGLFVTEDGADGTVYWHLTAIGPGHQGRGLGKRLWLTMLRLHQEQGMRVVETRISGHNTPVVNLYAALGARFRDPEITLHWVRLG